MSNRDQDGEPTDADELRQGLQFQYADGVAEAVVTTEGGRVLTVREYPTREAFRTVADEAVTTETNEELAALDAEALMGGATGPTAGASATARGEVAPMGTEDPEDAEERDEE